MANDPLNLRITPEQVELFESFAELPEHERTQDRLFAMIEESKKS